MKKTERMRMMAPDWKTLHHNALTAGAAVRNKITHILQGKNYEKLIEPESNIEVKLAGDKPIDPEYCDSLLVQLNVWKAKAKLKGMHKVVLDDAVKIQAELASTLPYQSNSTPLPQGNLQRNETHEAKNEDTVKDAEDLLEGFKIEMDPKPLKQLKTDGAEYLFCFNDALAEKLYAQEAEKRLAEAEESYNWEDKYRPHKPRYFYNQTHYNTDNPPPKVVQGYKFNIFYPNLIDKTRATTYKIIKNKENEDIATL
ncbi:cactus-binding C-terminus of cactin protein-domain-containing protein [Phakopsora pachyrhizi]|nr:cactus-binding C-terminus of cactin protein-domain-containing protein [Phakopsora pachyrhizi]